jgi:YesN/AraC family two-component response regulator
MQRTQSAETQRETLKILIADDESLARSTLRSILQELPLSLHLLEDATNGEEMVELVRLHAPQIVFVDIKMPRLNGLEAIKAAKRFAPEAKWFIMTGFSEFSFAQEALRIGVSDYLLKPVDPQEITNALGEIIQAQRERHKLFERELTVIFQDLRAFEQTDGQGHLLKTRFVKANFSLDSFLKELSHYMLQGYGKSDILTQTILLIEQHYRSELGIARIAEKLHVTPNYLSTLFHKRTGITFLKYVTALRMLKARELLADPDTQVQQVAEQVGYYSVRHFTRTFTACFGYYPSEGRKR